MMIQGSVDRVSGQLGELSGQLGKQTDRLNELSDKFSGFQGEVRSSLRYIKGIGATLIVLALGVVGWLYRLHGEFNLGYGQLIQQVQTNGEGLRRLETGLNARIDKLEIGLDAKV